MRAPAVLIALFAPGCAVDNPALDLPVLDHHMFVTEVQPVFERRCANPSCHGNDRRPFRVYATERFRQNPDRLHRDEPITEEELRANEMSATAFATGISRAMDSLLITKPLGIVFHQGGEVWTTSEDPECQAVLRWLRSGGLP